MFDAQQQPSLTNPSVKVAIPSTDVKVDLTPGGIKAVKTENKRNDSVIWMRPQDVTPVDGFNGRLLCPKRTERVRRYADDMKRNGFKPDKAISCYVRDDGKGGNQVVPYDGGTRLDAALLAISEGANIETIPVFLAPKSMSLDDILKAQITNNNGTPFSMLETALVVKRLDNRGHKPQEIADDLGLTLTHVDNLMVLASAPKMIQNMIVSEQIAATFAVDQIRKLGPEKAAEQLKAQLQAAQAQGKNKITKKSLPDAKFQSALKRKAPAFFDRVSQIRQDPGYQHLSEDNRAQLDSLVEELQALRQTTA